jgi:hypothetical protein
MKSSIWVYYEGEADNRDEKIKKIMSQFFSAKQEGSGFDFTKGERDQSWEIDETQVAEAKAVLEANGFRVRILDE